MAVMAASGRAAESEKERFFGLRATKCSAHLAYSLHEPEVLETNVISELQRPHTST
jgi:hypothetical protein